MYIVPKDHDHDNVWILMARVGWQLVSKSLESLLVIAVILSTRPQLIWPISYWRPLISSIRMRLCGRRMSSDTSFHSTPLHHILFSLLFDWQCHCWWCDNIQLVGYRTVQHENKTARITEEEVQDKELPNKRQKTWQISQEDTETE